MKPVIGMTASEDGQQTYVKDTYSKRIIEAGGLPVILPSFLKDDIKLLLKRIDGLLLTGGGDLDPLYFDEDPHQNLGNVTPRRDAFEISLVKHALNMKLPIFGICRGMQILNVASGGNLYQDIYKQRKQISIQHSQKAPTEHASHLVHIEEGSLLRKIMGTEKMLVNSFHHQAVKVVSEQFIISARATDGIIEAIESVAEPFVIGVQWHPEALVDQSAVKLFEQFIRESSGRK